MPNYSGVWTLQQQLQAKAQGLWPINGPFFYIEDMFSTYLYTGNGTTQTITNGIDLADKGGLVWSKSRSSALSHVLVDTVRGSGLNLSSDTTAAQSNPVLSVTSFLADGYTLGSRTGSNDSGVSFASWTFREQPKFFDVVTYTGTGVASRAISHNLGSAPGMMIVKRTDTVQNWPVYHRSVPTGTGYLNTTQQFFTGAGNGVWGDAAYNNIAPTSTVFYVGSDVEVNANGGTYVAYLFAHNAGGFGLTGTDNVISCGSVTSSGGVLPSVNLGFEPQWLLMKGTAATGFGWTIQDNMRGSTVNGSVQYLRANTSGAENADTGQYGFTSTGLNGVGTSGFGNELFIYIAIRRGPMKVPTLGTSVFSVDTTTANNAITSTLKQTDMGWFKDRTTVANWFVADRLRGFTNAYYTPTLYTNLMDAEATPTTGDTVTAFGPTTTGVNNGVIYAGGAGVAGNYPLLYSFKRAPGFFDEVCYTGTGVARTVAHNLTVAPELMMVKKRSAAESWAVYSIALGTSGRIFLNSTQANDNGAAAFWNSTAPTTTVFTVGTGSTNDNTATYVNYLFATCPGVSKVGSYTGTGALQTVACGFTTGTRFVLIKRTDAVGDWYVWDSARGISSGTDPYLLLNSTAAEVTVNNYVDTDTTGFKVTAAAPAALNAVGGNYIFLAIA